MTNPKYRVWDKLNKEMCPLDSFLGGDFSDLVKNDQYELMMYTGLEDSNKVEICSGDILRYTRKNMYCPGVYFHNEDLVNICSVYWDDKRHGFSKDSRNVKNGITGRISSSGSLGFDDSRAEDNIFEVIGNIKQNPELLKDMS